MRINKLVITLFCLVTILANLNANFLYAQNESGHRALTKECGQYKKIWYDSTNAMFQVKYPIIRSIPPLSISMPLDVLFSYVYTDSLLRFGNKTLRKSIRNSTLSDTLKNAIKYLYTMVDYNPIIFNQYQSEVGLNSVLDGLRDGNEDGSPVPCDEISGRYVQSLILIRREVTEQWLKLLPGSMQSNIKMFCAVQSDYILRVKVLQIDSMPNKHIPEYRKTNRYRVTAQVLDTLKGKVFSNYLPNSLPNTSLQPADQPSLIQFQYTPYDYGAVKRYTRDANGQGDPEFMNGNGEFSMKVGQEAVIFLVHNNQVIDSSYDYFDLDLASECLNALPIINSQVRDINKVWSDNTLLDYSTWKGNLQIIIQKIKTNNY